MVAPVVTRTLERLIKNGTEKEIKAYLRNRKIALKNVQNRKAAVDKNNANLEKKLEKLNKKAEVKAADAAVSTRSKPKRAASGRPARKPKSGKARGAAIVGAGGAAIAGLAAYQDSKRSERMKKRQEQAEKNKTARQQATQPGKGNVITPSPAKPETKPATTTAKITGRGAITIGNKANVTKEQLAKTGMSLRQYMNYYKKNGKRPTATASSTSSTAESKRRQRILNNSAGTGITKDDFKYERTGKRKMSADRMSSGYARAAARGIAYMKKKKRKED